MPITGEIPIRLLHVFPSFEVGGAQRRLAQLVNGLGRDFNHVLFAMDNCYDALSLVEDGVSLSILDQNIPSGTIQRVASFRKALKEANPHRLITYNWGSIEWALARIGMSLPHLHIEDGFGREESEKRFRRRSWARRIILSRGSTLILPSKLLYGIARDEWKLAESKIHYVPNGVDTNRFSTTPSPAFLKGKGIPEDKTVFATVAGLRREKNIPRLLKAYRDLADREACHLVIAGGGDLLDALGRLVDEFGMAQEVTFLGPISEPERVLAGVDVFVLSSDTEQMPLSILEAMATGLPIASVDVGDVKEMVSVENRGHIVEKNYHSLSVVMEEFANSPALRAEVGKANRAKAEAIFSMDEMISTYRRLFSASSD